MAAGSRGAKPVLGAIGAVMVLTGCIPDVGDAPLSWDHWSYRLDSLGEIPAGEPEASYSVLRAGNGRVVVLHRASMSIFNPDGTFLGKLGREGSGPGEILQVTQVGRAPDGTIWIWDSKLMRFAFLDAQTLTLRDDTNRLAGNFPRSMVNGKTVAWARPLAHWGDSSILALGPPLDGDVVSRDRGDADPAASQGAIGWMNGGSDGLPPLVALHHGDAECVVKVDERRWDVPQCPKRYWGISRDGRLLSTAVPIRDGTMDSYRFRLLSTLSGDTIYSRDIRLIGREFSQEMREIYQARFPDHPREVPYPDRLATVRYLRLGDDGTLWVGGILEGDSRWWHVIDPEGKPHAALLVPEDLYIQEVSIDGALATLDHENGQIILYSLALDGAAIAPLSLEGQ